MNTVTRQVNRLRKSIVLLFSMVLALSLGLAACGSNDSSGGAGSSESAGAMATSDSMSSGESTGTWPRTVTGDDGDVTLNEQPKSIVSTSVTLTGSLLAVDAPVVGSGAAKAGTAVTDDNGFFNQWSAKAQEKGVQKIFGDNTIDVEAVANANPDLILVAKTGGDQGMDSLDKLKEIGVPVLVIDYTARTWEDVTTLLGEATGHEADAKAAIDDFESKVSEAKNNITMPQGGVSLFTIPKDGTEGAIVFTPDSPQVQILTEMGIEVTPVPDTVPNEGSMGDRKDVLRLSPENVQVGLAGENWLVVDNTGKAQDAVAKNETFSSAPQASTAKYLPGSTFKLDYYSALELIDGVQKAYPKA